MDIWLNPVDKSSSTPLYEQLYREMKEAIIRGDLVVGTKLPSKRQLAEFLTLSQTTIELAYGQLVAEGFIKSVARSGYYVEEVEELALADEIRLKHDQPEVIKHTYSIDFNSAVLILLPSRSINA
jgi:GntR family transcriptional regulator/MocR family aminotransferase